MEPPANVEDFTGTALFRTTQWSMVAGVSDKNPDRRSECLNWLMGRYWKPVYAYLRRFGGLDKMDAEDLTQEFFTFLLQRDVIERARKNTAKFRTYLKAVLKNFRIDRHRMGRRIKRGGGNRVLSLDLTEQDERWISEEAREMQPEEILDGMWARTILDRALRRVRESLTARGRAEDWKMFEFYMGQGGEFRPATYREVAERFKMNEWNVWKRLTRVLEQLKNQLREGIAETVSTPDDVEEEFEALSELLR